MKAINRRFDGTFAEYKAYVKLYLETTGAPECYDEEVVIGAWDEEQDGIGAAIECKDEYARQSH